MTVFPEHPRLVHSGTRDGAELRRFIENHITVIDMPCGFSLVVIIKSGYKTDGASIPRLFLNGFNADTPRCTGKKKRERIKRSVDDGSVVVGTPWDCPRLLAAIVHDALYSIKWATRYICDRVYKKILSKVKYSRVKRELEYDVIRMFGWINWNNISEQEIEDSRRLIEVKMIRKKNVNRLIKKLKEEEKES